MASRIRGDMMAPFPTKTHNIRYCKAFAYAAHGREDRSGGVAKTPREHPWEPRTARPSEDGIGRLA